LTHIPLSNKWRQLLTSVHIMNFHVEFDREEDVRWIAEIPELPGELAYGATQEEAKAKVEALALRVVADKIEENKQSIPAVTFA
jgi:predicted RNase H-like HicB family nuclease